MTDWRGFMKDGDDKKVRINHSNDAKWFQYALIQEKIKESFNIWDYYEV